MFDADDLLMNTLGGLIGYYLVPMLNKILPTREELDKASYKEGQTVSFLRRITVFVLDFILLNTITILFHGKYLKLIIFICYYGIVPILNNEKTIGSAFLKVRFAVPNLGFTRRLLRQLFIYLCLIFPIYLLLSLPTFLRVLPFPNFVNTSLYLLLNIICFFIYLKSIIKLFRTNTIFYDNIFKITLQSTIKVEE